MKPLLKHRCRDAASSAARVNLRVEYRKISDLTVYANNPREHSPKQVRALARHIKKTEFSVPVLVDVDGNIIAGHGRILAAQLLGMVEVPTICLGHLNAAQVRAFRIADNRLGELSTFSIELLIKETDEILELGLELEDLGFESGALDQLVLDAADGSKQKSDDAHELPEAPAGPPVTLLGDVWLAGPHIIICADALDGGTYAALMGETRAAIVVADAPYNLKVQDLVGLGRIKHREFAMASGEMSEPQFVHFLTTVCDHLARHSVDGALQFLFMDWRHMGEILAAGAKAYSELKNLCVWVKDNGGMGSLYRSQHELIFVFKHGKAPHQNNIQLGQHGRHRTNVWRYAGVNSFGRETVEGNLLALHPTVKPVALVADALLDCSTRGDIVLDPFLGSGTTLIAAQRTGRRCRGIELDPRYVDVCIRRWQALTGLKATHGATGCSFDDIAAERAAMTGGDHGE